MLYPFSSKLHVSLCPNRDMFIYLTVSDYGDIKTPFGSLTHGLQYPSKVSPSRLDPHFFHCLCASF